jgi:hypothetical protein
MTKLTNAGPCKPHARGASGHSSAQVGVVVDANTCQLGGGGPGGGDAARQLHSQPTRTGQLHQGAFLRVGHTVAYNQVGDTARQLRSQSTECDSCTQAVVWLVSTGPVHWYHSRTSITQQSTVCAPQPRTHIVELEVELVQRLC